MKSKVCAPLLGSLMLLACQQAKAPDNGPVTASPPPVETGAPVLPVGTDQKPTPGEPPARRANADDDRAAAAAPPLLTPEAERGVKGARNILLSFARAIEQKQFGPAWALLSPADQRKWSRAQFAALFADLGTITVAIPDGTIEGAAGSLYYTAPVAITASDKDGRPVRIEGEAVLRRVNDVDGATPTQRRWHLETLTLDWTH